MWLRCLGLGRLRSIRCRRPPAFGVMDGTAAAGDESKKREPSTNLHQALAVMLAAGQ